MKLHLAVALILTLFLVACGKEESPATATAPATSTTPVTSEAESKEFVVLGVTGEAADSQPAISVRFSRPLAQAQDLSQYMKVTDSTGKPVDGSWVNDLGDRLVRFPHVKAQEKFKVEILPGIVSESGESLKQGLTQEIEAVDLPPAAGFASQGSVLPSQGTDGLPILTVNIAEVDVEFFRVKDSSVARFLSEYQGGGRRGYWDLSRLRRIADSVYLNRFVVDAAPNERKRTHLPVHQIKELNAAGLYFAVLKPVGSFEGEFQTTYFVRTDIGVHTRVHLGKLMVITRSLATGEALGGIDISILDSDGVSVVAAVTNSDGQVEVDYRISTKHVLVAKRGDQTSLLPFNQPALDLSEFDVGGSTAGDISMFLWSGRDLYRPLETLRVAALLRDFDGKPLAGKQPLFAVLKQPDGRPFATAQLSAGDDGYYLFERAMTADVPTGRWRLEVSPDPAGVSAVHGFDLRIEEFLPERLKLNIDSTQARLAPGDALDISVEGGYLYGAPASGNRFSAQLTFAVDATPVESVKGYFFGDPVEPPSSEPVDAFDVSLDEQGKLSTSVPIELAKVNGPIAVSLIGSLYESGGRPITRVLKRTIWPADALVGIRPLFDPENLSANQEAGFEVLKVSADGSRQSAAGLKVKLIREDRDYIWNYDNSLGWRVDFTQRFVEVEERALDLAGDAPGKIAFDVKWGPYRIEVLDPATGLTTRLPFTAGWNFDDDNRGPDARPDKVKLALDKSSYRAGDRVVLSVTPPNAESSPGLLLVESDRLLQSVEFEARPGATIKLDIDPSWERHDVYLTALVFRPGTAKDKITPSRAVGIVHLPIDRAERTLAVEIQAPQTMRPNQELSVSIAALSLAGKSAHVTVSAVDLGIINITRFAVPDAVKHFFGKRRYAVEAFDLYGRIIEALAGERARLKFGGDMALPGLPQTRRPTAKVLTVDLYSGPVKLDAQGKATIKLAVPDFNGALRVSALVYAGDQYGSASAETLVRAPLVAEVSTPRVMAPGDAGVLTLDLQNLSGARQSVNIQFEADSPISIGDAQRSVVLEDNARTSLRFPLTALGDQGVGKFRLRATGGEIALDRSFEINVRSANTPERRSRVLQLTGPGSTDLGVSTRGLLPSTVRSRVSASTRVPLSIGRLVGDLLDYPYGCIEQTTSKGYPFVLLDDAGTKALGMSPIAAAKRQTNVAFAIDRIASMQLENGHFAFWPGSGDYSDPQITPYVVEFLQDAEAAGFKVPAKVLQKSLERLREDLLSGGAVLWERAWGDGAGHVRLSFNAHAGMVLARVNQAPLGTLRNVFDNSKAEARGPLALMRLAVALKLAGDATRAQAAASLALGEKYQRTDEFWGDYFTAIGDRAGALALAVQHGFLTDQSRARVLELGQEAQTRRYLGTHDTLSLLKLAKSISGTGGKLSGKLVIGGIDEGFDTSGWFSRDLVIEDLNAGAQLDVSTTGNYFLVQDTVGVPLANPAPSSNGVSIVSKWYRHDGKAFTGDTLKEGEGLVIHLKVRATERLADAIVIGPLPGGLEIENLNLMDTKQLANMVVAGTNLDEWRSYSANVRYQEYREDRYVGAISADAGAEVDLYYLVRAVSPGEYGVPAAYVEDMYRPTTRGVAATPLARLKVVSPGAATP